MTEHLPLFTKPLMLSLPREVADVTWEHIHVDDFEVVPLISTCVYSKLTVLEFLYIKIFFTFLCSILMIDVSSQYCQHFRKKMNKWNLLKTCFKFTYPADFT